MNRRERLTAAIHGRPVDRTPVSFYEIDGFNQDCANPDPFNVFNAPSWKPLIELARDHSDVIVNGGSGAWNTAPDPLKDRRTDETWTDEKGSRFTKTTIRADDRLLTSLTRRDPDVDTVWTIEHLLKDEDDFRAWLALPDHACDYRMNLDYVRDSEARLGDAGIHMMNVADPVCCVASLFDMGTWTVMALTEPVLMRAALEKVWPHCIAPVELAARECPGHLWRIVGPEYAAEPYLPPKLFNEYVTPYVTRQVEAIQRHGGVARVHCHGRIRNALPFIAATGCHGLDPIEPPHQGDVELSYVREQYGEQMTLFGNIEITDIENMPTADFEKKIATALREGPGKRGFVLMPSACPYGRTISPVCLRNYERMIEMAAQC